MIHRIRLYILLWYPWWLHQRETFSALLALCAGNSPVTSEFPAQRPETFSLIWAWTNGYANIRDVGDLKRQRTHYTVIVMFIHLQHIRSSLWTYSVIKARHRNRFENVCGDYFYVPSCSNIYMLWDLTTSIIMTPYHLCWHPWLRC